VEQDRLDEFMTLIVGASRSVTKLKSKYMASFGLGSTHTMCIRKLYASENGLTRTQISEICELDKAQVSRIINELAQKGYAVEGPGKSNYKRRVVLTDDGKRIAAEINSIVLKINTAVSQEIPCEEIEVFYKVFGIICDNLKNAEDANAK
jgi:DNA-binding MarR family transcriptional regulator